MDTAYSQSEGENNKIFNEFSPEIIFELLESPQSLLEQLSIDFTRDISTLDLLIFSSGMVAYGIFIWHFYRLISRREIVSLPLEKYDSDGRKITSIAVYAIKYVLVFPLVITSWFFVYSLFMFFLAPEIKQDFVFLVVISLVIAIRISAYYKEDLSKDLAKMIPFALLGIFLVNTSLFTLDQFILRLDSFVPFVGKIAAFIIFAIGVEAVLRILFLIKRKLIPAHESSVDDEIERTIDARMRIRMEHMESKQKEMESKMAEKIVQTGDKLERKIIETEKKVDENKNRINSSEDNLKDKDKSKTDEKS